MPAPTDVVDAVVKAAVDQHAQSQEDLAYLIALMWYSFGGLDTAASAAWAEVAAPVVAASRLSAAERAVAYINLLHAIQTDTKLATARVALEDVAEFRALEQRAERFIDAPVVRARYEVAQQRERGRMIQIGGDQAPGPRGKMVDLPPAVARARAKAEQAGLTPARTAEVSDFADAMDAGATRAVQQHLSDANSAYGIGGDTAAATAPTKVARWLKAPHAGACERCFLVSTRGYRTSEAAATAGHASCRCGTRVIFVAETGHGARKRVTNDDWRDAVIDAGYGPLLNSASLSASARAALIDHIFPDATAALAGG